MTEDQDVERDLRVEPTTSVDPAEFRSIVGHFPTGVAVVTAGGSRGRFGMTVATFCSISLDPVLVGFFADRSSTTWGSIRRCGHFAVNVLAQDQAHLCRQFAGPAHRRYVHVGWTVRRTGAPILEGVHAWFDCRIHEIAETGDHVLVMGEVLACGADESEQPLVFYRSNLSRFDQSPLPKQPVSDRTS